MSKGGRPDVAAVGQIADMLGMMIEGERRDGWITGFSGSRVMVLRLGPHSMPLTFRVVGGFAEKDGGSAGVLLRGPEEIGIAVLLATADAAIGEPSESSLVMLRIGKNDNPWKGREAELSYIGALLALEPFILQEYVRIGDSKWEAVREVVNAVQSA